MKCSKAEAGRVGRVVVCLIGCVSGVCLPDQSGGAPETVRKDSTGPADEESLENLKFTVQDYPRVDGASSTHPLGVLVGCKLTGTPYRWYTDRTRKIRRLYPVIVPEISPAKKRESQWAGRRQVILKPHKVLIEKTHHSGTHGSYVDLIEGKVDLILVTRNASDEERKLAAEKHIELDARAIALDALVFLLHKSNPVESLTIQQIGEIYTRKITNWKQLGEIDAAVTPLRAKEDSGDQEAMERLVMKGRKMISQRAMVGFSQRGAYNALAYSRGGIGYTSYYYNRFISPHPEIKICVVEGVIPDAQKIRTGKYPLITYVYAVSRRDLPSDSRAGMVRDWLLARRGQKVVAESGYLPVRPPPEARPRW